MQKIALFFIISFLFGCDNRLTPDEISKMSEEQIKQVTPEQIGKMTPGELEIFKDRRSNLASERTKAAKEKAKNMVIQ